MTTIGFATAQFRVDPAARTLTGVLLPFGAISRPALNTDTGQPALWTFPEGTVETPDDSSDAVLNYGHDTQSLYMQVGAAASLSAAPGVGVEVVFKVARTPEGDRVLALAEDRVLKAFSAEVEGDFDVDAKHDNEYGLPLMTAKKVRIVGGAVVRKPAFEGAQITSVAASAAQNKEIPMTTTEQETGVVFSQAEGTKLMADVAQLAADLAELKDIKIPVGPGNAQLQVREEPIYRFAGSERASSGFDFGEDLLAAAKDGDAAALKRVMDFTAAEEEAKSYGGRFADQPTTTGDVAGINQPTYRDDLFFGQAPTPRSPLFDFFTKGTLSNITPFFWVKLDRANTDVNIADHTEGVEPESRDLVIATGTTVTPQAMSGKVHITREVGDQGTTRLSALIKNEWDRSFAMQKEAKTAALLAAAAGSVADLCTVAAGASGITLGRAIELGLIDLQFLADGGRFVKAFGHIDAYKALASAAAPRFNGDTIGEKEYPIINPQNRDGISGSKYSFLELAGFRMEPAAALGVTGTVAKDSWVADPMAVHVWASGLQRLDRLQEKVEGWDVGSFAYFAGVVYDPTGLRTIPYDPTP